MVAEESVVGLNMILGRDDGAMRVCDVIFPTGERVRRNE
jgi:hypothetical protein